MRAVVEFHNEDVELPHLEVMITKGVEDVSIKVSKQTLFIQIRTLNDLKLNFTFNCSLSNRLVALLQSTIYTAL